MVNRHGRGIDPIDGVAFPERQIEIAARVEGDRPRPIQRRLPARRAIRSGTPLAGSADRLDDPGREVDTTYPMVADIADQQAAAAWFDRDAVRLAQLGASRGAAVAREPRLTRP